MGERLRRHRRIARYRALCLSVVVATAVLETKEAAGQTTRCLTLSEARKLYPTTRLVYRLRDGARCWYAPGKPVPPRRQYIDPPLPAPPEQPPPMWTIEPERVPVQAIYDPPRRHTEPDYYDPPRRRSVADEPFIFSTFVGDPPDVWPLLPASNEWKITFAGLIFVCAFAVALVCSETILAAFHKRYRRQRHASRTHARAGQAG